MLQLLVTYAPEYLTREENEARLTEHLSDYYRFLGKSLIFGRDKQFWDYHKGELTKAGVGFSRARLAKGTLTTLCNATLNPKETVERLLQRRRAGELASRNQDRAGKQCVVAAKESQENKKPQCAPSRV